MTSSNISLVEARGQRNIILHVLRRRGKLEIVGRDTNFYYRPLFSSPNVRLTVFPECQRYPLFPQR